MNSNEKNTKGSNKLDSTMGKIVSARATLFGLKNFNNAIDFHPTEMICKNTWSRDVSSTHIRNKHLLDLKYAKPKCCADVYNITIDRQKQKKLKRYNLTRPVRSIVSTKEGEMTTCKPEYIPSAPDAPKPRTVIVPECYVVPESDSDIDEHAEYEKCKSGPGSECSICKQTPDCWERMKIHTMKRKRETTKILEEEFCKTNIKEEIKKHKLGTDLKLKLKKVF